MSSFKYGSDNEHVADWEYAHLLERLVLKAENEGYTPERTGTGATNIFGAQMRFDLQYAFPILTTKKVHWHSIVTELLWFLRGDTNIKYLLENNVHIWTDWRYKEYVAYCEAKSYNVPTKETFEYTIVNDSSFAEMWGDIGKGYGHQWRNFGEVLEWVNPKYPEEHVHVLQKGFDQIAWVINEIKTNPTSRRLIVSGWNPHEVDKVDLPPCHTLFQFFVEAMNRDERIAYMGHTNAGVLRMKATAGSGGKPHNTDEALEYFNVPTHKLSCQLYQRSADFFLGVPFNIASYALLTHIIAAECGLGVGEFVWTGGIVHLYSNHIEQAKEQLTRYVGTTPRLKEFVPMPFDQYTPQDFQLENYHPKERISAPVAV